jgi:RNA polymerase sigma-70 factor (ECF subfamily)
MPPSDIDGELRILVTARAPTLVGVQGSGPDLALGARAAEAEADRLLVARALAGDEDAFGSLVARYGQPVLSLCYASTLAAAEAEDLSQEIFLSVWCNLDHFRGESAFSTWLFALARNACIDRARRSRSRPQLALADGLTDSRAATGDSPEAETLDAIFFAARALSVPLRQALFLRDLQGLSYEEIATLQGIPIGTVRSRIAAARDTIAKAVAE